MATYSEWCEEHLEEQLLKLENEESRIPILQEMKDFLSTMPCKEITRTAPHLSLPHVFDCLNDSNSEQIDLACDVLSLCMTNLSLGESTNKYGVFLERALNHPHSGVKLMALAEIRRNFENDDILVDLCKRESLLHNIVKCLGDEDIGVAKKATEIINIIGLSTLGIKRLVSPDITALLEELCAKNEIVRFRVYEALLALGLQSENNFSLIKSTAFLAQMCNELNNDDILVRLNVLELLTQLGSTLPGFIYLESNQVIRKVAEMLPAADELTEPGILKFLGNLAHENALKIHEIAPTFLLKLFKNLDSPDFTIISISLDTIGHVGVKNSGKAALDALGPHTEAALAKIALKLPSLPTDAKIRALNCVESLVKVVEVEKSAQIEALTLKWFNLAGVAAGEPAIELFWGYAKNPFEEFRLAGLGVLAAAVGHAWGRDLVRDTPGLVEFLLDRRVETCKECKLAKYGVVEELLKAGEGFGEGVEKRLAKYVREGPFYVQVQPEVAVDGND